MNSEQQVFKYLGGYPEEIRRKVGQLVDSNSLAGHLLKKYPAPHAIRTDRALYDYAMGLKNDYLRKSQPLSKVAFDPRISTLNDALGLHTFVSRVQGGKLKAKNEIRVASVFKEAPLEFLRMIVVHELAHLKEKDHNRAFYSLCEYMEPAYQQLEFDTRLYLTHLELFGPLY
jgi:predicted metal-dependent hydrolase